jgi:L-ascorbate metabolism protein UlaG (beta-lactamase superfamily)
MAKIRWLGHAAWLMEFSDVTVVVDPFLTGNPKAAVKASDIKKADYVLVTHNHSDHLGDSYSIAKERGSKFVSMFELAEGARKSGVHEEKAIGMNIGNLYDFRNIKIGMTPAIHSGLPAGFIIEKDGETIYHAGDTAFFSEMKMIGEVYKPSVALLPIGGFFTMGPKEAAYAADTIRAGVTIPMHYGTFPQIAQDPHAFAGMVKNSKVAVLKPGEEYVL